MRISAILYLIFRLCLTVLKLVLQVDKLFCALDYLNYILTDEEYSLINKELTPDVNNAVQYSGKQ